MLKSPDSFKKLYGHLWQHISPVRRQQLVLLLMLTLLASFAEVASIGSILPFLGILITPEKLFSNSIIQSCIGLLGISHVDQLLLPLTITFILAVFFSGVVRLSLLWAQTKLSFAIGADFSVDIYRKTLYQPYATHIARNTSELISAISIKTASVTGIILYLLTIISSFLILLAIFIFMVVVDPVVSLAAFGSFAVVYSVIALITKKYVARDSRRISHHNDQVIKVLQEGLGGIRDVLIDGTQEAYTRIYREIDHSLRKSQANITIISTAPRFLVESFGIALIAVIAYGLAQGEGGAGISNAIPILGALAIGAQRLLPVLQQLYNSITAVRGGQSSLQDVLNLLDQSLPSYVCRSLNGPMPFHHSIVLHDVSFRHSEHLPWSLLHVDLKIAKGDRIGFIGSTGSGKSTLLDVIMGLLSPTSGKLIVDGITITSDNSRAWQAHIAHVPQNIFLADATIAENIAFGIPMDLIDYDRVKSAAYQAQLSSTIESWECKYATVVGERGIRLSGGQRQRIGIARALYKQADVIVLDEATSALDNDTEHAVMNAIDKLGSGITVLIVAHRLTTLKSCKSIIQLDNGSICREGCYQEIIESH
jgi:ATP-binding cassette subfamily B protein